jgi:exodeoxyribonuclease VII small subunit
MPKEAKRDTFEQLYARLDESVAKLERGGLSLEESIALYEQGMQLARECQERLDAAELKITKLRESFAALPQRNGAAVQDAVPAPDYEYVDPDEEPVDEDEPFA